ncbi:GT4 family glycosyltransferase PelF [Candidatus Moduliflexota bacterium]
MYLVDTHVPRAGEASAGGAEKQLFMLATGLDPDHFRTTVVQLIPSDSAKIPEGRIGNAEMLHFPTKRFYSPHGVGQIYRISRLARARGVDVIHTFFEKSEAMGWAAARIAGVPVWMTSRRDLGFKRKKAYDRMFRIVSGDCTRCIANCQAIGNNIIRRDGMPPRKVSVIYNGLDLHDFDHRRNSTELRKEICAGGDVPIVGMVANFNFDIKGQQYFIEAAKRVVEKAPEARFVLAGDGPLRSGCEEQAKGLGIRDKVHFLGERYDVAGILRDLTVSVLSSTSEGLSNVILESMAAAKPVVATDVGGNPELVDNGITGHVVPPADPEALAESIIKLLRSPDQAKSMGSAARARVEKDFSVAKMVERHANLYTSALGNGSGARNQP